MGSNTRQILVLLIRILGYVLLFAAVGVIVVLLTPSSYHVPIIVGDACLCLAIAGFIAGRYYDDPWVTDQGFGTAGALGRLVVPAVAMGVGIWFLNGHHGIRDLAITVGIWVALDALVLLTFLLGRAIRRYS